MTILNIPIKFFYRFKYDLLICMLEWWREKGRKVGYMEVRLQAEPDREIEHQGRRLSQMGYRDGRNSPQNKRES